MGKGYLPRVDTTHGGMTKRRPGDKNVLAVAWREKDWGLMYEKYPSEGRALSRKSASVWGQMQVFEAVNGWILPQHTIALHWNEWGHRHAELWWMMLQCFSPWDMRVRQGLVSSPWAVKTDTRTASVWSIDYSTIFSPLWVSSTRSTCSFMKRLDFCRTTERNVGVQCTGRGPKWHPWCSVPYICF